MPDETLFLNAWKRGVKLAGVHYFRNARPHGIGAPTADLRVTEADVDRATIKWELCPDRKAIVRALGHISRGEGAFLAAMYSFYNAEDGQKLLKRAGYPNICDLAAKLDSNRARIIADQPATEGDTD